MPDGNVHVPRLLDGVNIPEKVFRFQNKELCIDFNPNFPVHKILFMISVERGSS